jgi:predicted GIY-YIG superfamily endonuclease
MPRKRKNKKYGTVYLLHLDSKLTGHAGHYMGFTTNLEQRLSDHKGGRTARLMEVARERGVGFKLVRTWERVTRNFERQLKNRKNSPQLCPVCCARGEARCAKKAA